MNSNMIAKHTAGPWQYAGPFVVGGTPTAIMNASGRLQLATVKVHTWSMSGETIPPDEADANARLIAAAPDQHETLKEIMWYLDTTPLDAYGERLRNRVRAAIAKAEGTE